MKTLDKVPMRIEPAEFIPEKMEAGVFYYSEKYNSATHLCPCGCGELKLFLPRPIQRFIQKENNEIF